MLRIALAAAFAAIALAQSAPDAAQKAPAGVEEALRARVSEFYGYHVSQEYRKAEKLVAEESQDIFYVHNKPHYLSFEIRTITYSKDFTHAKVLSICEQIFRGVGFQDKPLKAPCSSTWKVVEGKWFWYVDQEELTRGPFGPSAAAAAKTGSGAPTEPPKIPTTSDFVMGQVKADKSVVTIKPNETQQVSIANGAAGTVTLNVIQNLPGIDITLDKKQINRGEKATVTLKAGDNPFKGLISFEVIPINDVITIEIKR
jgi:hypothetical protein